MKGTINNLVCLTITVIPLLAGLNGCKKDNADLQPEIKLGAEYEGGIIFYINGTGNHGLIATSADLSRSAPWWNGSFIETGATSTTVGGTVGTRAIRAF